MSNKYKTFSTKKENELKHELEREGWFVIRAAGSFGLADLVAIKPPEFTVATNLFDVRFIQIKCFSKVKEKKIKYMYADTPFGEVTVETHIFPHQLRTRRKVIK